jgi:hypothetical protein
MEEKYFYVGGLDRGDRVEIVLEIAILAQPDFSPRVRLKA